MRRGLGLYILDGHSPVAVDDIVTWGQWFEKADRHVADTDVGDVRISTVFLGVEHHPFRSFGAEGEPAGCLFETMVFGGPMDGELQRYMTWHGAERGHAQMVAEVEKAAGLSPSTEERPT